MKQWTLNALFTAIGVLFFCVNSSAAEKLPVYVSILPQKFFVESIGGDLVDVSVMVAPGANPHDYEPTPAQIKTLSSARIYFAIGDPFEDSWLTKITSGRHDITIIHTEDGIEKKPINRHEAIFSDSEKSKNKNSHGHDHGINDPHIWLSPPLVMLQARNILFGLIQEMPEQRTILENNYRHFISQLIELDTTLRQKFAGDEGKRFLVFHPAWGYFADAYHLKQTSIEIEGKEPKAKEIAQLINYAKERGIKEIFVQPQFSIKQAEFIAREINAKLVSINDLAENWFENMNTVASSVKQALR